MRSEQIAQEIAVEDHAAQNGIHERLQGGGLDAVLFGDGGKLTGVLLFLEAHVPVADSLLVKPLARFQRFDVRRDVVAFVDELGIGLDQADELGAVHLLLAGLLLRILCDQRHDVVVVDHRRGEKNEFEIELLHCFIKLRLRALIALVPLLLQTQRGVHIDAPEALQRFPGQYLFDGRLVFVRQIGVLVKLGFEALHLFEQIDELCAGGVPFEVGDLFGFVFQSLRLHESAQILNGAFQLFDDDRRFVHQPYFLRRFGGFAGKEADCGVDGLLLLAEVEDVAVGLGVVEHAVGSGKRLNQTVVLQVLVHVQGVQVLGVEAGEQHVHDDDDVDLRAVRKVAVRVLLVLDALLHVLIIEVESAHAVVGSIARVVVGDDAFEGFLLPVGFLLVVGSFLRQVFLYLLNILVALCGRREDAGDVQRPVVLIFRLLFGLRRLEEFVIFDGVVDRRGGQHGVELASVGGGVVLGENRFDDGFLGEGFIRLGGHLPFRFEVVHMEAQDVPVFDGVRDGVGVQLLLKNVRRGPVAGLLPLDLLTGGVLFEDGRSGESEQLGVGEEFLDGPVVLAELRAVTLVEDEDHALFAQGLKPLRVVAPAVVAVEREAELLDGGDDHLVGIVVRKQTPHQCFGVGVFFDATFLEFVEFVPCLPVEVFAVDHEQAFVDIGIVLEQR